MDDVEKMIAYRNVLTTEETCDIIGRSRQQLNNILKKGDINVFKRIPSGNLYWRPEVYQLLRKLNHEKERETHKIYGGSTNRSVEEFKKLNLDYSDIDEIFVFFTHKDSILKGFYNVTESEVPDTLISVEGARFIIVMKDGTEYWFHGLTCGYRGTGCSGTEEILSDIGILKKEEYVNSIIADNRYLHFWREDDGWSYDCSVNDSNEYAENGLFGIEENYYRYNNTLVLTHSSRRAKVIGEVLHPSKETLLKSLYFVPDPVSVEILSYDKALSTGHFQKRFNQLIVYQVIIKDISDRELWLDYSVDEYSFDKQKNMKDLFEQLGVEIEESKISDTIRRWLKLRPRNINRTFKIENELK